MPSPALGVMLIEPGDLGVLTGIAPALPSGWPSSWGQPRALREQCCGPTNGIVTCLFLPGQLVEFLKKTESRGPVSCDTVLKIFYQTCRAVQHMHKQKPPIIHRDLKVPALVGRRPSSGPRVASEVWWGCLCCASRGLGPRRGQVAAAVPDGPGSPGLSGFSQVENLLLSHQGTIKLCDFGSATTISHYPDYSWSAQKRALVEEEVSWLCNPAPCLLWAQVVGTWSLAGGTLHGAALATTPFPVSL